MFFNLPFQAITTSQGWNKQTEYILSDLLLGAIPIFKVNALGSYRTAACHILSHSAMRVITRIRLCVPGMCNVFPQASPV